jgi:hypothetical protein
MFKAMLNVPLTGTWQVAVGVPLLSQPVLLIEKSSEASKAAFALSCELEPALRTSATAKPAASSAMPPAPAIFLRSRFTLSLLSGTAEAGPYVQRPGRVPAASSPVFEPKPPCLNVFAV